MCTAITYKTNDSYFGRNLDLEYSYRETVTVTPRNYPFNFRMGEVVTNHYAMIGMAFVVGDYPLYYDAVNEHGLAMAGLNFPENAKYYAKAKNKENITPFEFIPWILGKCKNINETLEALSKINLWNEPFSTELPLSPLHWIISDKERSITVEAVQEGMKIYENPMGVLTNNPPFPFMKQYLTLFRDLTPRASENRISKECDLPAYCAGIGAVGLPGDFSSPSRFVKASFVKLNSPENLNEYESVNQFFHILTSVEMPRGAVRLKEDLHDITVYSSCCNQDKGIYYYTTYDNRQISAVDMFREDLNGEKIVSYELKKEANIFMHN